MKSRERTRGATVICNGAEDDGSEKANEEENQTWGILKSELTEREKGATA